MRFRLISLAIVFCLVGCGQKAVPVSGKITMDGKAVVGASVLFNPVKEGKTNNTGPSSEGKTDAEGKFTLRIVSDERPGAIVGKHTVVITKMDGAGGDGIPDSGKATIAKILVRSEQTFEVPAGGTDKADFTVKAGVDTGAPPIPPMPK